MQFLLEAASEQHEHRLSQTICPLIELVIPCGSGAIRMVARELQLDSSVVPDLHFADSHSTLLRSTDCAPHIAFLEASLSAARG